MESNQRRVIGEKKRSYLPLYPRHLWRSSLAPSTAPGMRHTVNSETDLVLAITELTVEWERTEVQQTAIQVNMLLQRECLERDLQATYFV